jgi:predicted RNA-binding protein with RPS1 domain
MPLIPRILQRNIYLATVVSIQPTYVILKTNDRVGICHISQVSDYRVNDINEHFVLGQQYYVYLLSEDEENNKAVFSYKAIRPEQLK